MKRLKLFTVALLCLFFNPLIGQVPLETQLEDAFSTLDLNQVPSKILYDRVPGYLDLSYFRGEYLSDSTSINKGRFKLMYGMIHQGHDRSNPMKSIDKVWAIADSLSTTNILDFGIFHYEYDRLKADALSSNLISFQNGHFYDVPNRSSSPYKSDACFGATLFKQNVSDTNLDFRISSDLIFSNSKDRIQSIEIDFDNGLGWQLVQLGSIIPVSYTDTGSYNIKIRATLTNRKTLLSQTFLNVENTTPLPSPPPPPPSDHYPATPDLLTGNFSGAELFYFANQSCDDNLITRPLIIIEGFEEEDENNWWDMINDELDSNGVPKGLLSQEYSTPVGTTTLEEKIHEERYDIFFVNFENASFNVENNAQYVKEIIRQINVWKHQNGSYEQNVVMGASMGGLVGKWALREMEIAGEDHETEYFLSFDSPLKGANIPLGMQYFIDDLANYKFLGQKLMDREPALEKAYSLVNTPAAKDMLYYHYSANDCSLCYASQLSTLHEAFQTSFENLGDLDIPHYSISNGALNNTLQLFGPGASLMSVENYFFTLDGENPLPPLSSVDIEIDVWALQDGDNGIVYQAAKTLNVLGLVFRNNDLQTVSGAIPYDSAPGGMRGTPPAGLPTPFDFLSQLFNFPWNFPSFAFIPTISSIGLDNVSHPNFDASDELTITSDGSTPITSYTGPTTPTMQYGSNQVNQKHVTLSDKTTTFLLHLFMEGYDLDILLPNNILDNQTYNFGKTEEHVSYDNFSFSQTRNFINYDLTIQNQGKLWVNRNDNIGITSDNNPLNSNPSHLDLIIESDCDFPVFIDVENEGEFFIGDWVVNNNTQNIKNTANVYLNGGANLNIKDGGIVKLDRHSSLIINTGAKLTVESGGTLRTSNPSQIIVKSGGVLEIEEGADIDLWWYDSTIHIEEGGRLIINGEFEFSGSGYFQFDKNHILTLNSDFILHGNGSRFIQLNKQAKLDIGDHYIELQNGKVVYSADSWIKVETGGSMFAKNVNFYSEPGAGGVALNAEGASEFDFHYCEFNNLFVGIYAENGIADQTYRAAFSQFNNCGTGVWVVDHPEFISFQSSYDGTTDGGSAIQADNTGYVGIVGGTIENFNFVGSTPLGAIDLTDVSKTSWSGVDIINNYFGAVLENVPEANLWYIDFIDNQTGSLLTNVTEFVMGECEVRNSVQYGIHAPSGSFQSPNNYSNIFLKSGTVFEGNDVGVQVDKGGLADNNQYYGRVSMDSAKMIHNRVGIQGQDVTLEIDAITHCGCENNPEWALPNTFIKNVTNTNAEDHFRICYVELQSSVSEVMARGNYWEGGTSAGTDYILRYPNNTGNCEGANYLPLNINFAVSTEPTDCEYDGPQTPTNSDDTKKRSQKVKDAASLSELLISPNPATDQVSITLGGATFDLEIFNSIGQKVYQDQQTTDVYLDLSQWNNGIYFIKVKQVGTEVSTTSKLVVQ